jgi:cytochrome c biogenesis protein CcdA/glutaredoxin
MGARRVLALLLGALVFLGALVLAVPAGSAAPTAEDPSAEGVTLVLFHGDGCPHCAAERAFLSELSETHPQLRVEEHEVWYDEQGQQLLLATAERLGFEPTGVPVTIIGDRVWIGFDSSTAQEITAVVEAAAVESADAPAPAQATTASPTVDVPFLGELDLAGTSLLASTLAIGFVDGVNPCSLWVLSLLLAMVLNRGSRGRVLLVGTVFLTVTAGMYALYMAGMYSAASYLSGMGWLRLLVAVVAGTFGVLQFKDGLGITAGPSLSISAGQRPGIYARMRRVASPEGALAATIAGTVALAVAVSLLETPCTAGLPLLWTTMLAEQGVGPMQALGLFAVYMLVFLLDELVIFVLAVVTLRATRVQERHGRALKLVAGSVLICLAVTMLVTPTALSTLLGTIVVFGSALVIAAVAYAVTARPRARPTAPRVPR